GNANGPDFSQGTRGFAERSEAQEKSAEKPVLSHNNDHTECLLNSLSSHLNLFPGWDPLLSIYYSYICPPNTYPSKKKEPLCLKLKAKECSLNAGCKLPAILLIQQELLSQG
ncbi:hypothetical protein A2U01_0001340, partial [Trifolium medium]|nr:hypothetical protein [Trifolium medium]